MGNTNSGSLDFEYNLTASDYSPVRKLQDFLFGEFYEVKHNSTGDLLLLKIRTTNDPHKYQQMIESSYQRLSLSHKNLAKFHGFAGREATTPLSVTFKIYLYFQPLPRDLARTIKNRKTIFPAFQPGDARFLPENQFVSIMTQLVDVLEYLQANGISHGDIRPEACFMKDDGNILLCDRKLLYEDELNLSDNTQEKSVLLSPAALEAHGKKDKNFKENKHKGDVFSLGMTLLECATFKRSSHFYEWGNPPKINRELLFARLSELQTRYSSKMYQLLAEMLQFEEQFRPDFIRLKRWVTGSEPIGMPPSSPTKKNESQISFGRSSIGPKLVGVSPNFLVAGSGAESPTAKLSISHQDTLPVEDGDGLKGNKKGYRRREDEDEVVEFETEETPKKNLLVPGGSSQPYQTPNSYSPISSYGSTYSYGNNTYDFKPYGTSAEPLRQSQNISDTYGKYEIKNNLDYNIRINDQKYDPKPEYNYTKERLEAIKPVSIDNIMKKAQETNSQSYLSSPTTPSKEFFPGHNLPNLTPSTSSGAYSSYSDQNSLKYNNSPGLLSTPLSAYSPGLQFGEANKSSYLPNNSNLASKPADTYNYSGSSYGTQSPSSKNYLSNNYGIQGTRSEYSSPYLAPPEKQTSFSLQPSPTLPLSNNESFLLNTPNKSLVATPKYDNSYSMNFSGDTEKWRSINADGLSYSTVLSVGPHSPKSSVQIGGTDLLTQQLQSMSKPYNSTYPSTFQKYGQDADSRTSIEQGDDQYKLKPGMAKQGSVHSLELNTIQSPEMKVSFSSPNTMRALESDYTSSLNKIKDSDMDDLFHKAMERSKETYSMVASRDNLNPSKHNDLFKNESLMDRLGREGISQGYKKY